MHKYRVIMSAVSSYINRSASLLERIYGIVRFSPKIKTVIIPTFRQKYCHHQCNNLTLWSIKTNVVIITVSFISPNLHYPINIYDHIH